MQYVAMLRGIGPGNPKMRNAVLADVLASTGVDDVRSVISSGNFVFSTARRSGPRLEADFEAALEEHLGSPSSAIVRSRRELEAVAASGAFAGHDDGPTARCNVTFLQRDAQAERGLPPDGDGWEFVGAEGRSVFFVVDSSRQKTPEVMTALERTYGKDITTRTWRTVHRILDAF